MAMPRNARLSASVAYLVLAAVDSYLAGREAESARRARYVTKPLLMPTLAVSTHLATQGSADPLVRGVRLAQLFSCGGDVALLGGSKRLFLTGVASFLAAHVCYIAGFGSARDPRAGLSSPGVVAGATIWTVTAPVMAVAAGRQDPTLRAPIAAYSGVLSAMFATSTLLRRSIPRTARRRIVAGTSLFLLSDSLLATQKFLRSGHSRVLESAVMATYTGGQFLIAQGAAEAASTTTRRRRGPDARPRRAHPTQRGRDCSRQSRPRSSSTPATGRREPATSLRGQPTGTASS